MSDPKRAEAEVNPYQASPLDSTVRREAPLLSWKLMGRLLSVVGVCAIAGTAIGLAVGTLIAVVAPGYYVQIFGLTEIGSASPLTMGIGLGLSQGLGGGVAVGVAVDLIGVWYLTRVARLGGRTD